FIHFMIKLRYTKKTFILNAFKFKLGGISMAFVITSPCKDELAGECVEVCPVDCIEQGEDMFFIDPDICIDCGACEAVCPVEAIYADDEVPEEESEYILLNRQFYENK